MAYLLDADVFIRAKRDHYRFTFCLAFWEWLVMANENERVYSINKVQEELKKGTDKLVGWAKARSTSFFLQTDGVILGKALERVSVWANQQSYQQQAVQTFLQSADYWLVAHALARGKEWKVVTHEVRAPESKKKIKLPDACDGVGVEHTNPFQMLHDEGARFVLGPKP